jgi:hypothetical protein
MPNIVIVERDPDSHNGHGDHFFFNDNQNWFFVQTAYAMEFLLASRGFSRYIITVIEIHEMIGVLDGKNL